MYIIIIRALCANAIEGKAMSYTYLDGEMLKKMLLGGRERISADKQRINDLNVFPVPDGDTGTNMLMTLESGLSGSHAASGGVGEIMSVFASGTLLGARGNSGVILSQIFSGIAEGLSGYDKVNARQLAEAYVHGIRKSYSAVSNPTEGTILTVFRESAEAALDAVDDSFDIEDYYRIHVESAAKSLERTREILPVLQEADVVDSGGAGYLAIAGGMLATLTGEVTEFDYKPLNNTPADTIDVNRFTRSSEMTLGYCTEFLLRLTESKCDPDAFTVGELIDELVAIGGESIVAYKEKDIVKVHVHLFEPGKALLIGQRWGEFLTVKIENMELGHSNTESVKSKPRKPFTVLAACMGEGICSLMRDMGADGIINGGQTQNPSTEEFLEAFRLHPADDIIVLPNNKNVMLAAKQAASLYTEARVHIIPTASVMEGYSALSVINPGVSDIEAIVSGAQRAASGIVGSEITCAVRDVTVDGRAIKQGEYISITNGKITSVAPDRDTALLSMLSGIEDMDEREIITLFVGIDVDDDARVSVTEKIEELYPYHELTVYKGKQEIYDYLVSVE